MHKVWVRRPFGLSAPEMNDQLADDLVLPASEELATAIKEGRSPALVIALGGVDPVRIMFEDYWMSEVMPAKAEHTFAQVLADHSITQFVFGVPVSWAIAGEDGVPVPPGTEPGQFMVGPPWESNAKMIWLLCYDQASGFDLLSLFYTQRNTKGGNAFDFAENVEILTGQHQMLDGAPGFTLMRDMLALT